MAALKDLVFKNWSVSDKTNSLNASLWNGAIGFKVYPKERTPGGSNQPLLKINLDQAGHAYAGIMEVIAQLEKSPLGTKIPVSKMQWDPQTRTRKTQWVITLEKDPDMCYFITLTDVLKNATFRFAITASQSITIGNEPPNKSAQSAMGLRLFKNWLIQAHDYAPFTAEKPGQFGGNRGAAPVGAPHAPAAMTAPAVAADPEDVPF